MLKAEEISKTFPANGMDLELASKDLS